MPKHHHPRRGSLQYWPRKRAKRHFARMRSWDNINGTKLKAFIGYKAGMTHIIAQDNSPHTRFKNEKISIPVTIIECPPLKPLSLRFYQKAYNGFKLISEIFSKNLSKDIKKYFKFPKKESKIPENFDLVRLRVHTQPRLTGTGQKKPDTLEIQVEGKSPQEQLSIAQSLSEKEIKLLDVLKDHKYLDVHSITKGKGFQGTVKRFGVKIRQHKAEKTKRGIGTLGSWHPNRVLFSVPQSGKMGYHQRTEYNKLNLLIDSDPKKINPISGFLHYGIIKNDYLMIKGSISGSAKRTIILTPSLRAKKHGDLQILSINTDSKQ